MSKPLRGYQGFSQRQFLAMAVGTSAAGCVGGGCATNPVKGHR